MSPALEKSGFPCCSKDGVRESSSRACWSGRVGKGRGRTGTRSQLAARLGGYIPSSSSIITTLSPLPSFLPPILFASLCWFDGVALPGSPLSSYCLVCTAAVPSLHGAAGSWRARQEMMCWGGLAPPASQKGVGASKSSRLEHPLLPAAAPGLCVSRQPLPVLKELF